MNTIEERSEDESDDIAPQLTMEEAKAIIRGGLGEYELRLVTSFCAPLYWVVARNAASLTTRNGTAFFLDAGKGPFGVTACHVIDGWRRSQAEDGGGPLRLGGNGSSVVLDWPVRVIAEHSGIDIATFKITSEEVSALGKMILTGSQISWPPKPPRANCGIYYSGYPGAGTRQPSTREVVFGATPGSGVATSISERDVSTLIEREHLMPALGDGIMPENFDFRGISGGPMITVVQNTLRSWALSGVIIEGPNTSTNVDEAIAGLEIIKARRAHFILPDGTLDVARWEWQQAATSLPLRP